jgi:hypothetical protein
VASSSWRRTWWPCKEVGRTSDLDQARDLLGPDFEIIDHPVPSPDGVGACLASRWPIGSVATLDLHLGEGTDGLPWAAAVAAEVTVPDAFGAVLVVHHKPNWQLDRERVRERQAVAATRWSGPGRCRWSGDAGSTTSSPAAAPTDRIRPSPIAASFSTNPQTASG